MLSKNEFEKAADMYSKAAHVSGQDVLDSEYLLKAGINYMKSGQNEEAKESFEMITKRLRKFRCSQRSSEIPGTIKLTTDYCPDLKIKP